MAVRRPGNRFVQPGMLRLLRNASVRGKAISVDESCATGIRAALLQMFILNKGVMFADQFLIGREGRT